MSFVLGIDGGGSKSTAAVSDGISVLATHTSGGCNLNSVCAEHARNALAEAVHGALSSAGVSATQVGSVCAGVAGAASPEVAARITGMIAELLPYAAIQVVGDTVIALEAAFTGGPGMVCISGTGSVAYGRNGRGELARAGGWGRTISDEGSGYWIGQSAVSQCLRAMDMGRSSSLIPAIMEHWGVAKREELVRRCHSEHRPNFADLFPVVLAAAEADDAMACELLTNAGIELAGVAQIVLRRLWSEGESIQVVVAGSVFANSSRVRQSFSNVLRSYRPETEVQLSSRQPFEGALHLAWQMMPDAPQAVIEVKGTHAAVGMSAAAGK